MKEVLRLAGICFVLFQTCTFSLSRPDSYPGEVGICRSESGRSVPASASNKKNWNVWDAKLVSLLLMAEILHQLIGSLSHYL